METLKLIVILHIASGFIALTSELIIFNSIKKGTSHQKLQEYFSI